jgi:acyl phosphate:glycerol-3-phosphate acyltransferase
MENSLLLLFIVVTSYLIGSLPTAYLIARVIHKVNIFEIGSGNMGGTNVARVAGLHWGILTVMIDTAKGMFAVYLAQKLMPNYILSSSMLAAVWAVIGHNWSVIASWLYYHYQKEFKIIGGKGAATAFGTIIMLFPASVSLIILIAGIGLAVITRYASLSVLVSFTMALTWAAIWAIRSTGGNAAIYLLYILALAVLILWRFRENIQRLMDGTERRIGERVAK